MNHCARTLSLLLGLSLPITAFAADGPQGDRPAPSLAPAAAPTLTTPAAPVASASTTPATNTTSARRTTGGESARSPARGGAASGRTLDDIHIEGEIPVPQVLFITTRDQRRFMEFQHRRYLKTSRQIGDDTELPTWIVVTRNAPTHEKETSR